MTVATLPGQAPRSIKNTSLPAAAFLLAGANGREQILGAAPCALQTPHESIMLTTMPHPYPIREIARQSGLSEATVDRVLNERPGVRASTAANVAQAIADLDRQRSQLRLNGRTFIVDVVMQTPTGSPRLSNPLWSSNCPCCGRQRVRSRFDFREKARPAELAKSLDDIRRRGSKGVILKAPDEPEITRSSRAAA